MPNDPQLASIALAIAPGVVFRGSIEFSGDWSSDEIAVTLSRQLEFLDMEGRSLTARYRGVLPARKQAGCRGKVAG